MALDVEAVRTRFSALRQPLAFFDGPGGTQVPDEVIEAVSRYYRESNANVSGPYETSRRTEALVDQARATAGAFLGCAPEETIFGANMFGLRREVLEGRTPDPEEVMAEIDKVTSEDVQRVAKALIEGRGLNLAVIGPFDDPARFETLLA